MTGVSRNQLFGGLITIAAVAAVAAGLVFLGPPAEERARQLDERRVRDLSDLAQAVDLYWTRRAALPASLEALLEEPAGPLRSTDPRSGEPYEYRALDGARYELCAQFERESRQLGGPGRDGFWTHASGRQCFQREAQTVR